ncbi:PrgI family protein, partial [Patescibacteria group bacterium]|nr:PrgI family protein [Patescibacteria group bacterium]
MQFKVPQNVQREDTIIGPVTMKQLIISGIGGGLAYAVYVSLAKFYFWEVWLWPVAIIVGITAAIAFLKIHDIPFYKFVFLLLEYLLLPKKRAWVKGSGEVFQSLLSPQVSKKNKKDAENKDDATIDKRKKLE